MLNRIVLMGRLVKDPELRYTASLEPVSVCNFTLAVDRNFKQNGQYITDFFDCSAWRKNAEFVSTHFTKGQLICIEGRIEQRKYEKNNEIRFAVSIVADSIYFAGAKKTDDQPEGFDPFAVA